MPMPNNRWLARVYNVINALGNNNIGVLIRGESNGVNYPIKVDPEAGGTGSLAVNIQDQYTRLIFLPLHLHTGNIITLTAPASVGDWTIDVAAGHGLTGGEPVATGKANNWYYGYVVSVAGNTLTLDRVINFAMAAGTTFEEFTEDMAINGSVTRQEFHGYSVPDLDFDITGMHISIVCPGQPDDSLFGDIAALTRGISLRQYKGDTGEYENMGTARTNGMMALFTGGDVVYTDKAGGGAWGVRVRASWTNTWGVTVRLRGSTSGSYTPNGRDEIHMIIQDNLTALDSMHILLVGHVVQ